MYLITFLILSLHVAIIVIFHSLHTFPFLKLLISGFIHSPSHCDLQRHKHLPLIVTTKHPCSFTFLFNCTAFFLGIWSTFPLSYPSRQILHNPFRTESTLHSWYPFNFCKCKPCLTFHSSGPSCWAFSIFIPLHHTCALLARFIYHSYLTGMIIRLLNRKLLGALNSCTTHYTGLHPLLT